MLTFIFITLLLQVSYVITGHTPPVINADKIVNIPECFSDDQGRVKWLNRNDIRTLLSSVRGAGVTARRTPLPAIRRLTPSRIS